MFTGLLFILMGLTILFYPQILVIMLSGILIGVGVVIMGISWQFRRLNRRPQSPFASWIVRW